MLSEAARKLLRLKEQKISQKIVSLPFFGPCIFYGILRLLALVHEKLTNRAHFCVLFCLFGIVSCEEGDQEGVCEGQGV